MPETQCTALANSGRKSWGELSWYNALALPLEVLLTDSCIFAFLSPGYCVCAGANFGNEVLTAIKKLF